MELPHHYILNEKGEPVAEPNLLVWARWCEDQQKIAGRIVLRERIGGILVSTIFLGLDNRFGSGGPPILWETMVFGGPMDEETDRCAGSREQAIAMHERMLERVKQAAIESQKPN